MKKQEMVLYMDILIISVGGAGGEGGYKIAQLVKHRT